MTPLDKTLKRALSIGGVDYVLTLTPDALKLTRKGKRLGMELKWADITSGESALAIALQASVGRFDRATDKATAAVQVTKQPAAAAKRVVTKRNMRKKRRR